MQTMTTFNRNLLFPILISMLIHGVALGQLTESDLEADRELAGRYFRAAMESLRAEDALADGAGNGGAGILAGGRFEEAIELLQKTIEVQLRSEPNKRLIGATYGILGRLTQEQGWLSLAGSYYTRALELSRELGSIDLDLATSLMNLASLERDRGRLSKADEHLKEALSIVRELAPDSLYMSAALNMMAGVAKARGRLDKAEEYLQQSLRIQADSSDGSLDFASGLVNLGSVQRMQGDMDAARKAYTRALRIYEERVPGQLPHADGLLAMGGLERERGELRRAEGYYLSALDIQEKLLPDSLVVAMSLRNLGMVALARGSLETADRYLKRSLRLTESLAPDSIKVASDLQVLGIVAVKRSDLSRARSYFLRCLDIQQRSAPGSLEVAGSLGNLAILHGKWGDWPKARALLEQALEIQKSLAPGSTRVSATLGNLGIVARRQGDLHQAKAYLQRSLVSKAGISQDGLGAAANLFNLANVQIELGELVSAENAIQKALRIYELRAPYSADSAEALRVMGQVLQSKGRLGEAVEYFERAADTLEDQITRLGASRGIKAEFRSLHGHIYKDLIRALLSLGKTEQAFHALERSRTRELLAMLAERDLSFAGYLQKDLDSARKHLAARYDRVQKQLAQVDAKQDARRAELLREQLSNVHRESNELVEEIRRSSPSFANLRYPEPLSASEAQRALSAGTVMLSFGIDSEVTYLFILTSAGALTVKSIPLGADRLRERIDRFVELISETQVGTTFGKTRRRHFHSAARLLFQDLIAPATEVIKEHERVLIVPDGPLHKLPWGALIRELDEAGTEQARPWQYFVEWKPAHVVASATLYGELRLSKAVSRESRQAPAGGLSVVAFGDPRIASNIAEQWPNLSGLHELPHALKEIAGIASIYSGQTKLYVGKGATEENVKTLPESVRALHFATHGILDDHIALNSALVLSIPEQPKKGQDNGLLQAWEIFENLRLNVDLVALSACESGLGQEQGGEGLIGLVRAFHYAGSPSVLASLWSVADQTTAELMVRFYRYLKEGKSKDEALRSAQLEFIRSPIQALDKNGKAIRKDASKPYYWAAFQVYGDWESWVGRRP